MSIASVLRVYFALFLGISGLAKIDRPFVELGGPSPRLRIKSILFSPASGRMLGAVEVVLALLLALGSWLGLLAMLNAALFGLFLLFKLFLAVTKLGSRCGCFGAHELIAVDPPSLVASALVFVLAVVLAVIAKDPSASALGWLVTIIFYAAFGWLVLRVASRRRAANRIVRDTPLGTSPSN